MRLYPASVAVSLSIGTVVTRLFSTTNFRFWLQVPHSQYCSFGRADPRFVAVSVPSTTKMRPSRLWLSAARQAGLTEFVIIESIRFPAGRAVSVAAPLCSSVQLLQMPDLRDQPRPQRHLHFRQRVLSGHAVHRFSCRIQRYKMARVHFLPEFLRHELKQPTFRARHTPVFIQPLWA